MICPRCNQDNLEGLDRCTNCMEPLRDRDVPQPTEGFQRLLMEEPVSAILNASPVVVPPDATVAEAVKQMKQGRTGCALVAADGLLVGIFTERDLILSVLGAHNQLEDVLVRDVMTRAPETVEANDSLRYALNKMSVGGFRHIPVIEGRRIMGLITAKDALGFLAREVLHS